MKSLAKHMILLGVSELIKYLCAEDIDDISIQECVEGYNEEIKKSILLYDCHNDAFYPIQMSNIDIYRNLRDTTQRSFSVEFDMSNSNEYQGNFDSFFNHYDANFNGLLSNESYAIVKKLYNSTHTKRLAKTILYKLYLADIIFDILLDFRQSYNADYDNMLDTICYSTWIQKLLNSVSLGNINIGEKDILLFIPRVWIDENDVIQLSYSISSCKKR